MEPSVAICIEHECFVNHSLGSTKICEQNIWGKNILGPKKFYKKKTFLSVENLSGICFAH